jgi:hypothetical protein
MAANYPLSREIYDIGIKTTCLYCDARPGFNCISIITDTTWMTDFGWHGQHQSRWALALRDHMAQERAAA